MIAHTKPPLTEKEALHLLYTLSLRAIRDPRAREEFRLVWDAYLLLVQAVYGHTTDHQFPFPCDLCRQHYAEDTIQAEELLPEAVTLVDGPAPPATHAGQQEEGPSA